MHPYVTSLALITAALGLPKSDEQPLVLRAYDITAASPLTEPAQGSVIAPIRSSQGDETAHIFKGSRSRESCIEVLQQLQPAEWELPGRSLEIDHDGRLIVRAPAGVQDGVALTLGFLTDTFGARTHLVFDVITTRSADADALSAQVPVDEIARWVAQSTSHQSYDVDLAAGDRGWVRAQCALDTVRSFDMEIAERAVGFTPTTERWMTGFALECQTAPGPGGSWLALAVQDVVPVEPIQDVDVRTEGRITTDSSIVPVRGPDHVQRVRLDERILALNAFLPDGKALAIRTTLDFGGDKATRILFVHRVGNTPGAITRPPENVKRAWGTKEAAFVRTDAYVVPRASVATPRGYELGTLVPAVPRLPDERYARSRIEVESAEILIGMMSSDDADRSVRSAGAWAILVGPDRAAVDAILADVSTLLPEPRGLQVTLTLKRGSRSTGSIARAVVPLRAGVHSTVVLERETTGTNGSNLYIAQGAISSAGVATTRFDGIAVTIEPRTTSTGGLEIAFDAHAAAPRGAAREFDPGTTSIPSFSQQDTDALDIQRTVTFAKSDAGPKRIVLGNNGTSEEALTLEVEITELH